MCYNKDTPKGDIKKKEVKTMFEMQKAKLETINKEKEDVLREIGNFLSEVCNEAASLGVIIDGDGDEMTDFSFKVEDGKIWFDYSARY